ncbi:MAG: M43 family zinc metalloprotease [Cyclobacteriaceae bacterium]
MVRRLLASLFVLVATVSFAQERCGTVALEKMMQQKNPSRETRDQFESWVKSQLSKKSKFAGANRTTSANYVVPIVVHVIHNGENVGVGTNISTAQILSQIDVLNQDYQRTNADTTNTLAEFKSVAGKFPITFVMAKQDPNGAATNGIVRVKGTQSSWSYSDNYTLKALSYWPAEDYLNIWVTNLSGGLLGYTQLPVSSSLKGLETASSDRITDGVVVHYQSYGTKNATGGGSFNLLSEYALGRTATHEIGHFFGLRHVWGDTNSCDTTYSKDYVYDTPIQDKDFNGTCPSSAQTDCGVHSMFANYMNYTDDECMNIFSKGQDDRMDIIINNSPRRASLLTSIGSQAPTPLALDAWAKTVASPGMTTCSGGTTPSLSILNYGTNTLNSVQVKFFLNGVATETKTFSSLNLASNAETVVSFSSVSLAEGTSNVFAFKILQANGTSDGNLTNDSTAITSVTQVSVSLPMMETFDSFPPNWSIDNRDGQLTWEDVSLSQNNHAMRIDFFNYEEQLTSDFLITPEIDLTNVTLASISFDHAYAMYTGGSNDRLRIWVSTTCDFYASPVLIYDKSGSALATASSTGSQFTPTSSQWQTTVILLDQFVGQRIQIAFEGVNDYGNDLYLDNVSVLNNPITAFTLNRLVSPSPVSCSTNSTPVIEIKNLGNTVISSFKADMYINSQHSINQVINGVNIQPGSVQNVTLPSVSFPSGSNNVSVTIKLPNGVAPTTTLNDSIATAVVVSSASDIIPLKQTFDSNLSGWISVSPDMSAVWYQKQTNKNLSMTFDAFGNTNLGDQAWLVSPTLDFSKVIKASGFFESSYAHNTLGTETLQVLLSKDCGLTFPYQLFSSSGITLSNRPGQSTTTSWTPLTNDDWTRNFLNLDSLVGKQNLRFAFVVTNGDGNNVYLDNIQFFVDDNQNPVPASNPYNVYGGGNEPVYITFNLDSRQTVRIQSYDMMGNVMADDTITDVLNQTYELKFKYQPSGIYIIRVQTASSVSSTKVLLGF